MSGSHDLLSRYTFALPAEAIAELRLALPEEVASLLDWSTLHIEWVWIFWNDEILM